MSDVRPPKGQALVLFALFLLVLLGVSALAIDYANWLLIDRQLQNVSDHAALAGAAEFSSDFTAGNCGSGSGPTQCLNARTQAWTTLFQELNLSGNAGASAAIAQLAQTDSPAVGVQEVTPVGFPKIVFNHTIWVSTPPPTNSNGHVEYTQVGGKYAGSFGIMFVRVDRPTRSYLGGVLGIRPGDRTGWATAGILPTDFALEVFCRDQIAPEPGVCSTTASLGIAGGGGISLDRGDVGSNNSVKVTSAVGPGVVVKAGNVFVVEGSCGQLWNCPPATAGGISDGSGTAKNAFYIPPFPVPNYALPTGIDNQDCATGPCVPGTGANGATPIDWSCSGSACGTPTRPNGINDPSVRCTGASGATQQHLVPVADITTTNFKGTASGATNNNIYRNINTSSVDPAGTAIPLPPSASTPFPTTPGPTDQVYSTNGNNATYVVQLATPNGTIQAGSQIYARFVLFRTTGSGGSAGSYDSVASGTAFTPTVVAQLMEKRSGVWTPIGSATASLDATTVMTAYQIPQVSSASLQSANNPTLGIKFTVTSGGSGANARGAGISWAEAYIDTPPVPPPPPMIPPGMYRSISIASGGCAVLDPTGLYSSPSGLAHNQMPGVYYFKDGGTGNQKPTIFLDTGSYLIGDGVTLVFDPNWPDPSGQQGIAVGANSALVINTARNTAPNCSTWYATNQSYPLCPLPWDALAAAWMIDPANPSANASSPWGGACAEVTPCSVARSSYAPTANYRGVSFYLRPKTNGSTNPADYSVLGRFSISGNAGSEPGIAFRGILYAPYDNVTITGGNGFNTIGMVLSWTAKFAGQATIKLDYPYTRVISPPYLIEPTVGQ
ncbi:MAG: Tad domain-containing protein [Chloroflexi bacterium]|nr:Tad domain-containing protein [Chloroflexota bacterium]